MKKKSNCNPVNGQTDLKSRSLDVSKSKEGITSGIVKLSGTIQNEEKKQL